MGSSQQLGARADLRVQVNHRSYGCRVAYAEGKGRLQCPDASDGASVGAGSSGPFSGVGAWGFPRE